MFHCLEINTVKARFHRNKDVKKFWILRSKQIKREKDPSPHILHASEGESEKKSWKNSSGSKAWTSLWKPTRAFEKNWTQSPNAFGSVQNLIKASKLSKIKAENALAGTDNHTKYFTPRSFFSIERSSSPYKRIWSTGVAQTDEFANYNNGVKNLVVAMDVSAIFLRVGKKRNSKLPQAQFVLSRECKQKYVFSRYGKTKKQSLRENLNNFEILRILNSSKNAMKQNLLLPKKNRSMAKIFIEHLEDEWFHHYINKLLDVVDNILNWINRVTGLASKKD